MAKFVPKRFEQILPQMIAKVVSRTALSDISDSSAVKHLLAAAARQDDEQYYQMSLLLKLFSVDKAEGDDLDLRASEIQPGTITRILARKSGGLLVFSSAIAVGAPVNIPIGTKVKTTSGDLFTTTVAGTILPTSPEQIAGHGVGRDSNLISAIADVPGTAGNVVANTIIRLETKPAGVDAVTNPGAFLNGLDKETDSSFRNRIKAFIASLPRSTVGAIEAGVIGQQDPITSSTVLFANVFEDSVIRGEVTLYVDDGTGTAETYQSVTGENVTLGVGAFVYQEAIVAIPGGDIIDTETFTIDDNVNAPTIFEFDSGGGVTGGNVAVTFVGTETADAMAILIAAAIDGVGAGLEVTTGIAGNLITVTHDNAPLGVVDITNTVADPDFITGQITAALGGETRLFLDNVPVRPASPFTLTSTVRGVLVLNTDYTLNTATGQINFTPSLVAGEVIVADYTHFTGLIQFVQKIVDGDPNDRATFPGLRAAGVRVTTLAPQVLIQNINTTITVSPGFDQDEAELNVRQAIKDYVNGLSISGDVIRAEITKRIMNVPGVFNSVLLLPATDIILLDDQLARTTDVNIVVS